MRIGSRFVAAAAALLGATFTFHGCFLSDAEKCSGIGDCAEGQDCVDGTCEDFEDGQDGQDGEQGGPYCDTHREGWCICGPKGSWYEENAVDSCEGYACCYAFTREGADEEECACSDEIINCAATAQDAAGEVVGSCPTEGEGPSAGPTGGGADCGEEGLYCDGNVLRDCSTDDPVTYCDDCKYIGAGTGSEYDTTCKDRESQCGVCDASGPWSGPGCYYGGGPAVCG